ncbi:PspA/IM30 family protein [Sediminicola luteus]|jgi:phage shock protein A|uniref:Phage shock protein A n=1 Tax=Sediminicola luteus TaxID=319238 RepID=A0A2A4G733_9FLAO|nr:PspA/IM30 family protein [Sediminicola luteus]PCE64251.1 phage shock protein A [Sediminicola luteus]
MNFFKRLFKIGQAEAHASIDKLEDPIKMTEQGIRDLKEDLEKGLESLAKVKALAIRSKNDITSHKDKAAAYHSKATLLLQKAQKGDMELTEAERLAKEALLLKEQALESQKQSEQESEKMEASVLKLESAVKQIRTNITKWENELKTLKARVKVGKATKNLNKQMAEIDSSGTVSLLEKMKDRVAEEEALAEAYGEMANANKSIDEEIDKAVDVSEANAQSDLDKLKEQLGLNKED